MLTEWMKRKPPPLLAAASYRSYKNVIEHNTTDHKRQKCNDTGPVEIESLAYTRKDSVIQVR